MSRRRTGAAGASGYSLVESLVVVALLGLIVALTAPIESDVLARFARLGRGEAARLELDLARAALAGDARRALRATAGAGRVQLVLAGGGSVDWQQDAAGLVRAEAAHDGLPARVRRFATVSAIRARTPRPGLLDATLAGADGEPVGRVTVRLNHAASAHASVHAGSTP